MLHNTQAGGRFPIIHATQNMVGFVPNGMSHNFSDPSYHLRAFYELFAIDGPPEDSERWCSVAQTSRAHLVSSAHPTTGPHPTTRPSPGRPTAGGDPSSGHASFASTLGAW